MKRTKIRSILVCVGTFFCVPLLPYNFAAIAHDILHTFETQKIRSNFARDLYAEITQVTENFTKNLTYDDLEKYVDPLYLDYMATEIAKTNTNTYVAMVWPVTVGQDAKIMGIFNKYCNVICSKRILFNDLGARNLLAQIPSKASHPTGVNLWFAKPYSEYNPLRVYLIECKSDDTDYEVMKEYLTKIFSNNKSVIEGFENQYGKRAVQNLFVTTKCKREIRTAVKLDYAMHINDMHDETVKMAHMLFNKNSIDCMKFSDPAKVKTLPKYNESVRLIWEKLKAKTEHVVVYNSAVLSAYGLRDCSDLDFLHDPRVSIPANQHALLSNQNQFFKRLYVILEDMAGKHWILEDAPHAHEGVDLDAADLFKVKISIDDLIYNPAYHFYFYDLKYATLDFMHYFKKKRAREKDVRDVELIEKHFLERYQG